MAERYKVTVEEDNDFSIVSWLILIGLGILCFVYIGIPLLILYLLYKLIKYFIKRNKMSKDLAPLKCPSCGKKDALRHFKDEIVYSRPKAISARSKSTGPEAFVHITEICTRHFEKCRFCGEIHFSDSFTEC